MSALTLEDTVVRAAPVLAADTGTEILAMDERSGNCFSMSGSGRLIWEYAKAPIRVADICTRLRCHYTVDEATCTSQTLAYIDTLIAENLLKVEDQQKQG